MKSEIIAKVARAGFDVYMRAPHDTWLIFTDGNRLGLLEHNRMSGYSLSTIHIPNTTTGTGFRIEDNVANFDKETLERAFTFAPYWARGVASVRKYRDIEHYRARDSFNAAYKLVAKANG